MNTWNLEATQDWDAVLFCINNPKTQHLVFWNKLSLFVRKSYCCHCLSVLSIKTKKLLREVKFGSNKGIFSLLNSLNDRDYHIVLIYSPMLSTRHALYPLIRLKLRPSKE